MNNLELLDSQNLQQRAIDLLQNYHSGNNTISDYLISGFRIYSQFFPYHISPENNENNPEQSVQLNSTEELLLKQDNSIKESLYFLQTIFGNNDRILNYEILKDTAGIQSSKLFRSSEINTLWKKFLLHFGSTDNNNIKLTKAFYLDWFSRTCKDKILEFLDSDLEKISKDPEFSIEIDESSQQQFIDSKLKQFNKLIALAYYSDYLDMQVQGLIGREGYKSLNILRSIRYLKSENFNPNSEFKNISQFRQQIIDYVFSNDINKAEVLIADYIGKNPLLFTEASKDKLVSLDTIFEKILTKIIDSGSEPNEFELEVLNRYFAGKEFCLISDRNEILRNIFTDVNVQELENISTLINNESFGLFLNLSIEPSSKYLVVFQVKAQNNKSKKFVVNSYANLKGFLKLLTNSNTIYDLHQIN